MTEQIHSAETGGIPSAVAAPPTPNQPVKKKKSKKQIKRILAIVITLVVVAAAAFSIWFFVFREPSQQSEILPSTAMISSIQSSEQGSGNARAKDTAAITLTAGGTVSEVFVSEGQVVTAGQPLYTITSQAAEDAVTTAQETLTNLQKDLADLQENLSDLTITAPFSGKLIDVGTFEAGTDASAGAKVCTLVNDKVLKLSLYYSYAYENSIYVGQSVQVSIPAIMGFRTGTVEQINKVSFISPEGGTFFEVVITLENPGTLTEGMSATASMTAADGTEIYPYENSTLEYYEKREITVKAAGPVLSSALLNYANVNAGDVLLSLGDTDISSQIRAKEKEITAAQEKLTEAQTALANFNAVAPIDGTVTSCSLTPGQEVKSGDTVLTISNTTTMVVEITVDDRNISFVKPGMTVDLTDYNGNTFLGTVTNINMTPDMSNGTSGMTNYPVTLTVDNYDGTLLQGMWLDYSFVTSQSDNCIVIPIQCVKSITDAEGNAIQVVFLQADSKPENAVDVELPEPAPGETRQYPTEAEGYYPVPVETGLNDQYNVEITSGLNEGDVVFNSYMMTTAYG